MAIGIDSFLPFGQLFSLFRSGVKGVYNFGYQILHASTQFHSYGNEKQKLAAVLSSPAVMKVFALQCDLFSLGKVYVYNDKDDEVKDDPFCDLMKHPNPFQARSQFLWDFMFWNMLGTDYCYVDSKIAAPENKLYFLDPSKIEWPRELEREKDKLIFSDATLRQRGNLTVTYRYEDGTTFKFPLNRLVISTDLTNGLGNWYKGPSRLDALYKIISNSEHAIDSKNINLRYSGKFLVGSQNDTTKIGLGNEEKKDIEDKIDSEGDKKVWALKTMVQIRRFVDDFKSLELGKSYLEDYFLVGSMYGIPRDVLEAYNSATYENQEKARAAHVNYCFEPKGNQFMDSFEKHFGYDLQKKNISMDWTHLPFMQVFEKEKAEVAKIKIDSFASMIGLGISTENANAFLDTDFEIEEKLEKENGEQGTGRETEEGESGSGEVEEESTGETEDIEEQ
jgi:hypothetical protein